MTDRTQLDERLRALHEHACGPYDADAMAHGYMLRDCRADEGVEHEVGVCDAWDAIRDAAAIGAELAYEDAAIIAACYPGTADCGWGNAEQLSEQIAEAIRAAASKAGKL